MNLKVKAVGIVVGLFAITMIGQGIIAVIAEVYGPPAVFNTFVGVVLAFLIYQLYTLVLQRLESDKKLEELSKKG